MGQTLNSPLVKPVVYLSLIRITISLLGMFVYLIISIMCVKFVADNKEKLGYVVEEIEERPLRLPKRID